MSEVYPLNDKEQAAVAAKAEAAGEAARLAWAKENAPITAEKAGTRAYAVALWLMTASGKVGSHVTTLQDLYDNYFKSGATDVHYVGFYPRGVKGPFEQIEAFNRLQLERIDKSVEGLAIIIAQILCKRASLDEVHEISQADWGIQLPGGSYFVVAKSTWGRWKQKTAILKKRTPADVFLIECMKVLGFEEELEDAYRNGFSDKNLKGYEEVLEKQTDLLLNSSDRNKQLAKKQANKETREKAYALVKTAASKLRKKD